MFYAVEHGDFVVFCCRTPHGVRGLKCNYNKKGVQATKEDVALRMGRGLK